MTGLSRLTRFTERGDEVVVTETKKVGSLSRVLKIEVDASEIDQLQGKVEQIAETLNHIVLTLSRLNGAMIENNRVA